MNTSFFNRFLGLMKIYLVPICVLSFLFVGCRKLEEYKFSTDLAIDSRIVRVAANADTTRLIVYADGSWTMQPLQEVNWASLANTSGNGKGEVIVKLEDNTGKLPRSVKFLVKAGSKTDTIDLQQRGLVPSIVIADLSANSIANGGTLKSPIVTNVPLELMGVTYRYLTEGQENWISDLSIRNGYLYFKVGVNPATDTRSGVLYLSYLDALGTTTKDSIRVNQNPGVNYDGAVAKDFAYVKQSLVAGEITENVFIEGVVVSDKGHPNMAKNLNKVEDKHVLDKTENAIAVYVQSLDGTSGLYFKTKNPGDNIFNFNDRVKIWLKGATLEKFSVPDRAVIKNIETIHVMEKEEREIPLLPREKYIGDLTDNDLYTYMKLKEVEISVPSGAFTNINEGYTARLDCYPMNLRDIQGNSLYMLTNLGVSYRRDGNRVPQGSGTVTGILVHEQLERYGGNIGKYSIRHLKRDDIALNADRNNGFSNVLIEWSRFKTEFVTSPTTEANPLTPDIGTGKIYQSSRAALDFTINGHYVSSDYNGLLQEPTTNKGSVANGGWGSRNWWKAGATTGEFWGIEVSTVGITNPISLQIEGNTDIGGPRNFIVEWSGNSAGPWNTVGTFTFEDLTDFSNTLLTQLPGYKVVNFQFPQEASGLANLYIHLRVANKTAGTATSPTGGTINVSKACRLGHVSIKYNK